MKYKRFAVYWFDPEPAQGSELRKVRPCIVVSPNEMNDTLRTVMIVPLTSSIKDWPFRVTLSILGQQSSAACDQLRSVDKTRLRGFIEELTMSDSQRLLSLLRTIFSE